MIRPLTFLVLSNIHSFQSGLNWQEIINQQKLSIWKPLYRGLGWTSSGEIIPKYTFKKQSDDTIHYYFILLICIVLISQFTHINKYKKQI